METPIQRIIRENEETRLVNVPVVAKRLHRLNALKLKHGLTVSDNSKAYYAKLTAPQKTTQKISQLSATVNRISIATNRACGVV